MEEMMPSDTRLLCSSDTDTTKDNGGAVVNGCAAAEEREVGVSPSVPQPIGPTDAVGSTIASDSGGNAMLIVSLCFPMQKSVKSTSTLALADCDGAVPPPPSSPKFKRFMRGQLCAVARDETIPILLAVDTIPCAAASAPTDGGGHREPLLLQPPPIQSIREVLLPSQLCIHTEYRPVADVAFLQHLVRNYDWYWAVGFSALVAIANVLMMLACVVPNYTSVNSLFQVGLLVTIIAYPLQISTYNRNALVTVMTSFDFWFVTGHMMVISCIFLYGDIVTGSYVTAAVRVPQDLSLCVAIFGMDASSLRRFAKAFLMAFLTCMWFTWAYLMQKIERPPLDDDLQLFPWVHAISVRSTISTCAFTLGIFCAKYAVMSIFMKADALMLHFNPRKIRLDPQQWGRFASSSTSPENTADINVSVAKSQVVDERMAPTGDELRHLSGENDSRVVMPIGENEVTANSSLALADHRNHARTFSQRIDASTSVLHQVPPSSYRFV